MKEFAFFEMEATAATAEAGRAPTVKGKLHVEILPGHLVCLHNHEGSGITAIFLEHSTERGMPSRDIDPKDTVVLVQITSVQSVGHAIVPPIGINHAKELFNYRGQT